MVGARLLVVEDDKALARLIRRTLRQHNFALETVASAREARLAYDRLHPDLVLLDLDLADSSAWELISEVRSHGAVPIIVTSAHRDERDTVAALELGADDFIVKPFGVNELLARIRVALRRMARPTFGVQPVLRVGSLEVDVERRRVVRAGRAIRLTPTEYQLLKLLATHPDRILSDRLLIQEVWGPAWRGGEHILHVYMARLRKKLEDNPAAPRCLLTEPRLGYRFATDLAGQHIAPEPRALAS